MDKPRDFRKRLCANMLADTSRPSSKIPRFRLWLAKLTTNGIFLLNFLNVYPITEREQPLTVPQEF